MTPVVAPLARSLAQITDPAFFGTLVWSLLCAAAVFAGLHIAVIWIVHDLLAWHGSLAWLTDLVGEVGATLLALWLFLPLAALIATFFVESIARAVERRHYPTLPPAPGASLIAMTGDGLRLAWRILLLNILALVFTILLPGIGLMLAWAIGAYAIGRGLFMAVALRRFDRRGAEALYAANRGVVLAQGAALALAAYLPGLNLLVPVIGTAAMVHVLDAISQRPITRI